MRWLMVLVGITCLVVLAQTSPVRAETVTMEEALNVANNWVTLTLSQEGNWGGSETAEVVEITEFKRGDRVIGYFCRVEPQGFVVISLRKELVPVKAYSETCDLDPESEEGLADLIKLKMEGILDSIEQQVGPLESTSPENVTSNLEFNYLQSWAVLESDVGTFKDQLQSEEVGTNYQTGGWLLTSWWHQKEPYNDQCPNKGCIWFCNSNNNALVGCVATAGAQIMRYWNWPPYGVDLPGSPLSYSDPYDWTNMPDGFTGCTWPQVQVDAVAELCHEIGVAVNMDYGCSESSAYTYDMGPVYSDLYRYSHSDLTLRDDYSNAVDWFNHLKAQFNLNRPVHYRVEGHSLVGDGWRERIVGGQIVREYHMNYGWQYSGANTWYVLDNLTYGGIDEEYILENIYPAPALGSSLAGTYSRPSFPYRYFDQDATGASATFEAGQNLQFLPNVEVTCTSKTGGAIQFLGSSSYNTRLYTRGDPSKGIRIYQGTFKLDKSGSIKLP